MSKFTHAMCDNCWNKENPDRPAPAIQEVDLGGAIWVCCFCWSPATGIFVRRDPDEVQCEGDHSHWTEAGE